MLTSLLRTHPVLGLVLGVSGSALLVVLGVAGLLGTPGDEAAGAVLMGFLVGLGLLMAASLVSEAVWRSRRPFARLDTGSDGSRATLLPFAATPLWARAGLFVLLLVAAVAGGLAALDAGSTGWAVVAAVVAVVALVSLLPVLLGRVRPGGLRLTADGVEHRRLGSGWRVRWDDLEGVVPRDDLVPLVVKPGGTVERLGGGAYGWRGDTRTQDDRLLGVDTRYLSVDGARLAPYLALYLAHPQMRGDLGSQASLDWARTPTS